MSRGIIRRPFATDATNTCQIKHALEEKKTGRFYSDEQRPRAEKGSIKRKRVLSARRNTPLKKLSGAD